MTRMLFKTRSVPVYALTFLSGIASLQFFTFLVDAFWISFIPLLLLISLFNPAVKLATVFIGGFLWALFHAHWYFLHVLPGDLVGQSIVIEGQIIDIPKQDGRVQRFMMDVFSFNASSDIQSGYHPVRIKLNWYGGNERLLPGQYWQFRVKLKPPHGFMNPGGFDYERWLYQNRIHATGYVKKHSNNRQTSQQSEYSIDRLRHFIVSSIAGYTSHFSGLISALAVGYKGDIPTEQWQVLTRTGTNHLMAISGLHIGLIAGIVFWLARRLAPVWILKKLPCPQFASLFSLIAASVYALLAGFAIPTQRAMVMLCVVLGGILLRRQVKPLNSLSWALIAVLTLDPVSILAPGFWFSFMAVAVIAYCFCGRLIRATGLMQWGRLQLVIALALFPMTLFLFQQASMVAPLANLLLVPWVSFIVVPLTFLASLSLSISPLIAQCLFQLTESSFKLVWPLLQWSSELSLASWQQAPAPFSYVLLATAGVTLLLAPRGLNHRWLGLIMLLPSLLYRPQIPDNGDAWIDVLDVGQGLAIVIQTRHHILVYDTGPKFSTAFDTGERVIVPYLKHKGIRLLDKMIISHADNDHIGGASSLISHIPITEIMGQGIDHLQHEHKTACIKGQKWRWDQVDFEILHPDKSYKKRNNRSCVLRIDNGKASFLVTADIENKIEHKLINNYTDELESDVMLVPHHGSKTSSTDAFIKAVNPTYAIVSAGYKNRFQHPRPEVLDRYESSGIKINNTANQGAINITLDAETGLSTAKIYRTQARHYWNHGLL